MSGSRLAYCTSESVANYSSFPTIVKKSLLSFVDPMKSAIHLPPRTEHEAEEESAPRRVPSIHQASCGPIPLLNGPETLSPNWECSLRKSVSSDLPSASVFP